MSAGGGWTVYEYPQKRSINRACRPDVAQQLDKALALVVAADGTAPQAQLPGFRVAGKTGTAQKFDFAEKAYSHKDYWASFIGYVDPPTGQSRKIVYVMVDEPRSSIYGGMVAAPAFQRINRRLVSHLNYASEVKFANLEVPAKDAPGPPESRPQESEVAENIMQSAKLMPDFTGQTIRAALVHVGAYRRSLEISGQGRIVAQKPLPGTVLEPGLDFVFKLSSEI